MRMSSVDRLRRFKQKRDAGFPRNSAAQSHVENEAYNAEFEKAWQEMNSAVVDRDCRVQKHKNRNWKQEKKSNTGTGLNLCPGDPPELINASSKLPTTWLTGPLDPSGCEISLSDRPLLCSSANWERREVVVGGSDHALYVLDIDSKRRKRTLYSKSCGHTEWVSCVAYMPQGDIVSGGMDSKICLWRAGSIRCIDLLGHTGSISSVAQLGDNILSSSYDKTMRIWKTCKGGQIACLQGHKAPILEMEVCSNTGRAATGDRSGCVIVWDLMQQKASLKIEKGHGGHVTSLAWFPGSNSQPNMLLSGGQDGVLRVWDIRSGAEVDSTIAHASERKGTGAVGSIEVYRQGNPYKIVTAGADGYVNILDSRGGFESMGSVALTDFPYSLCLIGDLALCGCGDGSLHVISVSSGIREYCLGVNKAAVRAIEAAPDALVCCGDDGSALIHNF